MNDDELRAMIRDSIAKHVGSPRAASTVATSGAPFHLPASHGMFPLARGNDDVDGACLIEPSVRCSHCGFCVSYGH
jgi:hypothetical protein